MIVNKNRGNFPLMRDSRDDVESYVRDEMEQIFLTFLGVIGGSHKFKNIQISQCIHNNLLLFSIMRVGYVCIHIVMQMSCKYLACIWNIAPGAMLTNL